MEATESAREYLDEVLCAECSEIGQQAGSAGEPSAEEAKRQGWDQGEVPGYWYGSSATVAQRAGTPCALGDACTTDFTCDFHAGKPDAKPSSAY